MAIAGFIERIGREGEWLGGWRAMDGWRNLDKMPRCDVK